LSGVWFVFRTEVRHRWKGWAVLAVLVAVVGGLVLGATAAGRRTVSAFPRFVATYGYDSIVYSYQPLPKLKSLPEVASADLSNSPANGIPWCSCQRQIPSYDFTVNEIPAATLPHYAKLVAGAWPDQNASDQVLASTSLAHDYGVHVGTIFRIPIYSTAQVDAAQGNPTGPAQTTVSLRVVGIGASESDFPSVGTPSYEVITTRAFDQTINPTTQVFDNYYVRLRHGSADAPRLDADVMALGAVATSGQETSTTVTDAIHPQAEGWWLLALLAAIAGLAVVAQALSRQAAVEDETYRTLAAIGFGRLELMSLGMARALAIGIAGAFGAVAVAFALSPIAPVGEARVAQPSSGFSFDSTVLGLGGLAVVLVVVVASLSPALRSARATRAQGVESTGHTSPVVKQLATVGAPASMVVGVHRALERGRGKDATPVGTALAGTALAVAALCATSVFAASLGHLTTTPRLYGQPFSMWFNNLGTGLTGVGPAITELQQDPAVQDITLGTSGSVTINGVATDAIAGQPIRGPMLVSAVSGRLPASANEIALGTKTLRQSGAKVGSVVRVSAPQAGGGSRTSAFRVVGSASFPPDFGVVGLSNGAIFTITGFIDAQCPIGAGQRVCRTTTSNNLPYVLLAHMRAGASGAVAVTRYVRNLPSSAIVPVTPANLVNFGEAVNFPAILGAVLLIFGAATLLHLLVVSVVRRRRELGLLKAIGFTGHQAAAAVSWQATTVALVGIVVGVPVGVIVGRGVWRVFATNVGVVPDPVVLAWELVAISVGTVIVANVLAIGPCLSSSRARPGPLLRAE
jgi:hypothetical protein